MPTFIWDNIIWVKWRIRASLMVVSQSLIPDLVLADQEQVGQTLQIREDIKWFEGEHSEKHKKSL